MGVGELLTAAEACALLGVKAATLYAYVSRGLIRSESGPAGTRERRYHAEDVQHLRDRQAARRDPAGAVQDALHWGMPVLESALTRIADGALAYRGHDLAGLLSYSVEEVAALLWTNDAQFSLHLPLQARLNLSAHPCAMLPTEALAYALVHGATHDVGAFDRRPKTMPMQAARVLNLLYATLERFEGKPAAPDLPLHMRLARAWGVTHAAEALRVALIVLADHELNVSTFAARVTASSGASLYHATLAALCALQGPQHGLAAHAAYELLEQAAQAGPQRALQEATRRHAQPPGFGHLLYPQGDPRASLLFSALDQHFRGHPSLGVACELQQTAAQQTAEHANIDLALATFIHLLGRPSSDTLTLFALARSVGWLAHALETIASGQMIRPRARYKA